MKPVPPAHANAVMWAKQTFDQTSRPSDHISSAFDHLPHYETMLYPGFKSLTF